MLNQNEREKEEQDEEMSEIEKEIDSLSEEVKELKTSLKKTRKKEKTRGKKEESSADLSPSFNYLNELLEKTSENIIAEMKSEFFRLFNFLSSMLSVTPNQKELQLIKEKGEARKIEYGRGTKTQTTESEQRVEQLEKEKELLQLLLEERESLIYELSDQLVVIENAKKALEEERKKIEKEKQNWENQKAVLEKLVKTDPRFNIINLLRRMGVIAPIQLSFVLGVSLSQTKKYIRELEDMQILKVNEDDTVSLHPSFNEETMNIKM
ncbi:MAG: hypothetical protein ACTSSG_06755 [Candidatus Heimdallarchaeaceae archaeon]